MLRYLTILKSRRTMIILSSIAGLIAICGLTGFIAQKLTHAAGGAGITVSFRDANFCSGVKASIASKYDAVTITSDECKNETHQFSFDGISTSGIKEITIGLEEDENERITSIQNIEGIEQFPYLEKLTISNNENFGKNSSDNGINSIAGLPNLKELTLTNDALTYFDAYLGSDNGISPIQKLEKLDLSHNASISYNLYPLYSLKTLYLQDIKATDIYGVTSLLSGQRQFKQDKCYEDAEKAREKGEDVDDQAVTACVNNAQATLHELDVSYNMIDDFSNLVDEYVHVKTYVYDEETGQTKVVYTSYVTLSSFQATHQTLFNGQGDVPTFELPNIFTEAKRTYLGQPTNDFETTNVKSISKVILEKATHSGEDDRYVYQATFDNPSVDPNATFKINGGVFDGTTFTQEYTGSIIDIEDRNLCSGIVSYVYRTIGAYEDGGPIYSHTCSAGEGSRKITFTAAGPSSISELQLPSLSIERLGGIENFTGLSTLNLSDNKISDLSKLADLWSLSVLSLSGNQITDISPLTNLSGLTELYLQENSIVDISALAYKYSLTILKLNDNQIVTTKPLKYLSSLVELRLSNNQINDASGLVGLSSLKILAVANNQLNDNSHLSSIGELESLVELYLGNNNISDISWLSSSDGTQLENIGILNFEGNSIEDISAVSKLTTLTLLDLTKNNIKNIAPVAALQNVTDLDLDFNKITDINALSSMPRLHNLNLKGNQISDISALKGLAALEKLILAEQTLTGTATSDTFDLPVVFSQALDSTAVSSRVSNYVSTSDKYTLTNATIDDYSATPIVITFADSAKSATVTIGDGALSGTKIIIEGSGTPEVNYSVDNKTNGVVVEQSPGGITIQNDKACVVLYTTDGGASYQLVPAEATGTSDTYFFSIPTTGTPTVTVALKGDIDLDGEVNVYDIMHIIRGISVEVNRHVELSSISKISPLVADLDGDNEINIYDVMTIVRAIKTENTQKMAW